MSSTDVLPGFPIKSTAVRPAHEWVITSASNPQSVGCPNYCVAIWKFCTHANTSLTTKIESPGWREDHKESRGRGGRGAKLLNHQRIIPQNNLFSSFLKDNIIILKTVSLHLVCIKGWGWGWGCEHFGQTGLTGYEGEKLWPSNYERQLLFCA